MESKPRSNRFPFDQIPSSYKPPAGMKLVGHPLLGLVSNERYDTVIEVPRKRDNRRLSGPGLRAFFRVSTFFGLDEPWQMGILGIRSRETYSRYRKGGPVRLRSATLERISHFLVIAEAMACFIPDPDALRNWLKRPNVASVFGNHPPLEAITHANVERLREIRYWSLAMVNPW